MANLKAIFGNNCLLQLLIDEVWYDVLCAKTMSLDWTKEKIETTSINSTKAREFIPGMSEYTVSCSGVTKIDNSEGDVSMPYLMQAAQRDSILDWRVYLEAQDGDTLQITFSGFFISQNLSGDVTQFSQSSITIQGTGDYEISEIIDAPVPGDWNELYKTLAEGAISVSDPDLDDSEIILVEREGVQQDETTGSPVGRRFRYDDSDNSINFDPLLPGNPPDANGRLESIHIIYKPN